MGTKSPLFGLGLALLLISTFIASVGGDAYAARPSDPLIQLLIEKGVVGPEEIDAALGTRADLIEILRSKGVITAAEAASLADGSNGASPPIALANAPVQMAAAAAPSSPAEDLREAVSAALPSWLKDFKLFGDIRLRYEGFFYQDDPDKPQNRERARMRIRLGGEKTYPDDGLTLGFRLGMNRTDAKSLNQTFDDRFEGKPVRWDKVYLLYNPPSASWLTLGGGKVTNPFYKTFLVWDSDVTPEGFYEQLKFKPVDFFHPFVTVAQFWIDELAAAKNPFLYAFQGGAEIKLHDNVKLKAAGTYYDFSNMDRDPALAAIAFGNTLFVRPNGDVVLANDYKLAEAIGEIVVTLGGVPFKVFGDYVANTDVDRNDTAFIAGIQIGKVKKRNSAEFKAIYGRTERDSVWGGIMDSNFGDGVTNRKGWKLGFAYQLLNNLTASTTVFLNDRLEPDGSPNADRVRVQANLVGKFK